MRLLRALRGEPLRRPPVWFMRQAGRYLPEYRELRSRYSFEEAMRTPAVAAEISLQPMRRFPLDAAIVFSDIMTPLMAMGVGIEFAPGPKLAPLAVKSVAELGELDPGDVDFVAETIETVRSGLDMEAAVVGFAGGPATLLAYLLEGGGSQQFPNFRRAANDAAFPAALDVLAQAMNRYLRLQIKAGADVVQLFDSWAGLLSADQFEHFVVPAARRALAGLDAPTVYFAPASTHLLEQFSLIGATAYGVDWRLGLAETWRRVGHSHPLQGNLDPAALLADPPTARAASIRVLEEAAGRPGHIFNLGHGILPATPVENVKAMVQSVVGWAGTDVVNMKVEATS